MSKALARQLKEIQEEGSLNVGYSMAIFKDENFDFNYMIGEILPDLIDGGVLAGRDYKKYIWSILLDEYLSDLEVEEFQYIAKYFLNYKQYNNKGE